MWRLIIIGLVATFAIAQSTFAEPEGDGWALRGKTTLYCSYSKAKEPEMAIPRALNWLARHQNPDGSWSLDTYTEACKDKNCTGTGAANNPTGATAMALLPFLAAGQTHLVKSPYQKTFHNGLLWLLKNQDLADGNLASKQDEVMYGHGIATIVLCEAYGLSEDETLRTPAQKAIDFIVNSHDPVGGGWRHTPKQPADLSVVGCQVMALKSGSLSGLKVPPATVAAAQKFLRSCAKGKAGGLFSYTPDVDPSLSMTAVGLLCSQYLGAKRTDPSIVEGTEFIMQNLPDNERRNSYYWFHATQVMHNQPGPDWDSWRGQLLRALIESQCRDDRGCAAGSWDPVKPMVDPHSNVGGRIYTTALATLSLELDYHYLPLFKAANAAVDGFGEPSPGAKEDATPNNEPTK